MPSYILKNYLYQIVIMSIKALQRGTADAEIKDPSVENPEFKVSLFKARYRSEYSHASFTYRQMYISSLAEIMG